jgi:hypothetical protein
LSSWAVVTPGGTACLIAAIIWRTICPAARMPSNSSGPLIDTKNLQQLFLQLTACHGIRL